MTTTVFADRLRNAMIDRGMKQIDLVHAAERSGVKMGKSHISQYVAGKTMPREDVLDFLAGELKVDANWLKGDLGGSANAGADLGPGIATSSSVDDGDAIDPESTADTDPIVEPFPEPTHAVRPIDDVSTASISTETGSTGSSASSAASPSSPSSSTPRRRTFGKSHKLDHVLYDVRGPVVDEAARMEADGTHILKLNIGNPAPFGFRTPDEVVYDMAHQLTETEGYSPSKGLFSARKAIMQYAQLKNLPNVTIDDIYTGNGVSELINLCMSALLDDGDEVLIPSPDYPLWTACVNLAGGTAVHYVCDESSEWYPDIDDMRAKITDRTVAIVLINPNNPTGALYPKEVLEQIVELAREHHLMIFSDEIYDRLVMDGLKHTSIASLAPDLFCVTFSGLSKSHMIAGYRVGWMVLSGNKRIARDYIEGINMLANMRICSNVPAQSIVQTALGGHQSVNDYIVPGGRLYEQREYIYNAINAIPGLTAVKPKAAFYIFPKIDVKRFHIHDDEQFALDLLHDQRILITRGGGFNWGEPDHFRIVYLPRIEVLKDATAKIADFFSYYWQS
ncbi:aminotransferase [Bifidobacterium sp. UTCIF-37]|uniref:aminotransferase class I/II-fold pyridoxal phosphate-dependent enzyme n=1 Tax=unclassified Bifidobacterium TaxID=2608897 RepID=UPI002159A9C4|nr:MULTISPECIES: aminotransferase class I/II-fold pyridoxal phosphate-dependent enzyme [unclassified Bifidobacterium]TPF86620.1 aminotransferase [Bifidobacterium sp. UTCIF-37]TPF90238.1 aminotransferase [Bifidobacterium sp. UTCIF-38]